MKKQERKKSRFGLVLMILGLLLAAGGAALLLSVPDGFDYILPAPAFSAESPAEEQLARLAPLMEVPWAAALRQQQAPVSPGEGGKQSVTATIYAVSEGFFDISHETLAEGRLLNRTDMESGTVRALVNRAGAERLFTGGSAMEKRITADSLTLEIVGITEGGFRPGEADEILIYIPITAADTGTLPFRTMEIRTRPAGREEKAVTAATLQAWSPGGTVQDAGRTRLAALMPLWLIACAFGFYALRMLWRRLRAAAVRQRDRIREDLREQYASRVAPKAALRVLLILLLLAAWLGAAWLLLSLFVRPLYTFTDWIPDSPADPASVAACVRNLLMSSAFSAAYLNCTASALKAASFLICAGSLAFLAGLVPFRRKRS